MQKEIKVMETEALTINKLQFPSNEHTFLRILLLSLSFFTRAK